MEESKLTRFNATVLPHMAGAYNFARWLTHDPNDAEDLVQDAFLRAFQFFDGFRGGSARAWLLSIVRNTFCTSLRHNRAHLRDTEFDEAVHLGEPPFQAPDELLMVKADKEALKTALASLPVSFREVIILREFEEMSYKEISGITEVPIGTVMSRLARARKLLQVALSSPLGKEETHELRN
jgi:RNA polymerase sigma-70 factor (ECF subfamily)